MAALARHTLWISDAYLVAPAPYLQALRAAVEDGVDVRVLVPGASDIPITAAFSRAGYRPLLEMGVRVFEWNGSMMHAKTAVADGEWLRVGSSNLNVSSIVANYELDVAAHDENIAQQMEEWFLRDLQNATEIVLGTRNRVQPTRNGLRRWRLGRRPGSVSRAAAGALRIGSAVGAAITNRRLLGPAEAGIMWKVGAVLMVLAVLGMLWPEAVAVPIGLIGGWIGLALLARAWKLRRQSDEEAEDEDEGEKTD
jgi:cardiolipin synthase